VEEERKGSSEPKTGLVNLNWAPGPMKNSKETRKLDGKEYKVAKAPHSKNALRVISTGGIDAGGEGGGEEDHRIQKPKSTGEETVRRFGVPLRTGNGGHMYGNTLRNLLSWAGKHPSKKVSRGSSIKTTCARHRGETPAAKIIRVSVVWGKKKRNPKGNRPKRVQGKTSHQTPRPGVAEKAPQGRQDRKTKKRDVSEGVSVY